jgi:protein-serine/threonine kinase
MAASSLFAQWDRQKSLDLSLDLTTSAASPTSLPNTPESNPSTSFIPIVVEPPQRVYIPQPNLEGKKGFGLLRHDRHSMQYDEKPLSPIATAPGPTLLKVDEARKPSSRRPSLTSLLSLNRRSANATPSAEETSLVSPSTPNQSPTTALQTPLLYEKYGICQDKSVGEGATAIIRLVRRRGHDTILAVKEFRKRSRNESERQYMKRMTSEFCISKPLDHENIIQTYDLLKDDRGRWCTVLEWVSLIRVDSPAPVQSVFCS